MTESEIIASLRGVWKVVKEPDSPEMSILQDINFDIAAKEIVAIIGPSGSGKSTLLNIIGLLDTPTRGTVTLQGREIVTADDRIRARARAATIGFVFQQFHLIPTRTVLENVCLGGLYSGMSRRERRTRAHDALCQVGLSAREKTLARTLSGGEKQRVAIARSLMTSPRLLLCDEPTGNLDSKNSSVVCELLVQVASAGPAVVVVTHDLTVAKMSDRVVSVADGCLTSDGVIM